MMEVDSSSSSSGKRKRDENDDPKPYGYKEMIEKGMEVPKIPQSEGGKPSEKKGRSNESFLQQTENAIGGAINLMANYLETALPAEVNRITESFPRTPGKKYHATVSETLKNCDVKEFISSFKNNQAAMVAHALGAFEEMVAVFLRKEANIELDSLNIPQQTKEEMLKILSTYIECIGNLIKRLD